MACFKGCHVVDGLYSIGDVASPSTVKLACNNTNIPVYSGYPDPVAAYSAQNSCNMSAMHIIVLACSILTRVVNHAVIILGVPAVDVVHITIAIIIHSICSDFPWVSPHVSRKIRVIELNSRVDYPNHHVLVSDDPRGPGVFRL